MLKRSLILLSFFLYHLGLSQTQLGQDIDGGNSGEGCGWSIDMSNDGQRIIVGSPFANSNGTFIGAKGEARVFELVNGSWIQVGSDIIGTSNENFGFSVCMSGDGTSFAVGGPKDLNGIVKVYRDSLGVLVQKGSDISGNDVGWAVELSDDGNTLVVSSPDYNSTGLVRVYRWENSDWEQIGYDIIGSSGERTGIGIGLSFDGSVLAVGTAVSGSDTGFVKTYNLQNDTINDLGNVIKGTSQNSAYFGYSLSLGDAGYRLAIGNFTAGEVSVYEFANNLWTKIGTDITPTYFSVDFGFSIALSAFGDKVAIGSRRTAGNGLESGRTEIYEWSYSTNDWVFKAAFNGDSAGDQSGYWVAISDTGNVVGIGAPYHLGGQVRVFDISALGLTDLKNDIKIFPNPTSNNVHVSLNTPFEYEVFNLQGQLISSGLSDNIINLAQLTSGYYRLHILTDKGLVTRIIEKI